MGDQGGVYYYGGGWNGNKSGWTFTADLSTLTIGYAVDAEVYGSDGHYVTLNNVSRYQLDALTAKMTTYLRELDAKFKTECSGFASTL